MSTSPQISCLALDADGDLIWDSILTDIGAVSQLIQTRLLLFQGEWWGNTSEGLPLFQNILSSNAPNTARAQAAISSLITQRIMTTPYVQNVTPTVVEFNPNTRTFFYNATIQTAFGQIAVNFTPANMAVLPIS